MFGVDFPPAATFCLLGLATVLLLYWYSTRNHDYWKKLGIPFVKPLPLLGSMGGFSEKAFHQIEEERYSKFGLIYGFFLVFLVYFTVLEETNQGLLPLVPVVEIYFLHLYYEGCKPFISVAAPELIRDVLVRDFSTFHTRRVIISNNEIFDNMVSVMQGDDNWKRIRTIITPTFTTGKIKKMLNIFKESSHTLVKNFQNASKQGKYIDAKKLYGAFTMDVIASSAFSTKIDSHNDPENLFVQYASRAINQGFSWKNLMFLLFPNFFKFTFFPEDVMEFFKKVTFQIIEERKKTGQTRNDFLQLLMDTAKEVEDDHKPDLPDKDGDITSNYGMQEDINPHIFKTVTSKKLSMTELVSQCVSFFLGGYETTATTLSFASYFLALNPEVQDKLREEVDNAFKESEGELTYEAIQSMKYLDNVISETLRLYPPLVRLDRSANAEYKLGDTGITIRKGMLVSIPVYAIQRDPKIYPDPEKFNPDRFTPEERAKRDQYTYLPFGAGPRNCVAMRFALIEVKICLAYVIANFNIKRCLETKVPLEFGKGEVLLQPKGIILEMETRKDSRILL